MYTGLQRRAEQRLARAKAAPAPRPAPTPPKRKRSASVEVSDEDADEAGGDDAADQAGTDCTMMMTVTMTVTTTITALFHVVTRCWTQRGPSKVFGRQTRLAHPKITTVPATPSSQQLNHPTISEASTMVLPAHWPADVAGLWFPGLGFWASQPWDRGGRACCAAGTSCSHGLPM